MRPAEVSEPFSFCRLNRTIPIFILRTVPKKISKKYGESIFKRILHVALRNLKNIYKIP